MAHQKHAHIVFTGGKRLQKRVRKYNGHRPCLRVMRYGKILRREESAAHIDLRTCEGVIGDIEPDATPQRERTRAGQVALRKDERRHGSNGLSFDLSGAAAGRARVLDEDAAPLTFSALDPVRTVANVAGHLAGALTFITIYTLTVTFFTSGILAFAKLTYGISLA